MKQQPIYSLAGIGIGPFNLGLAALVHPMKQLKAVFLDAAPGFNWHAGMMLEGATLQVSFLADLVTLANPCSPFSYLNFLRTKNRLLQFGIHERPYIAPTEYNRYCQWVAAQLPALKFGNRVERLEYDAASQLYKVSYQNTETGAANELRARHAVAGIGSRPFVPGHCTPLLCETIFHAADYLFHQKAVADAATVLVVGAGQSAAEIVDDLLQRRRGKNIIWATRSDRFRAMENHKLAYEMTSPDYTDYFYNLPHSAKHRLLQGQHTLYKGINQQLIDRIYDHLYGQMTEGAAPSLRLFPGSELYGITRGPNGQYSALLQHFNGKRKQVEAGCIILATGYTYETPKFLEGIRPYIGWLPDGRYAVNRDYSITADHRVFVQNGEMHTHGFNAPDLGLGCYRNAVILNAILGYECYPIDRNTAFQEFDWD